MNKHFPYTESRIRIMQQYSNDVKYKDPVNVKCLERAIYDNLKYILKDIVHTTIMAEQQNFRVYGDFDLLTYLNKWQLSSKVGILLEYVHEDAIKLSIDDYFEKHLFFVHRNYLR